MILLPIKPKYAFAIMNNQKKVEFRKVGFKNLDSDICIVYASSPYKKLIGYFKIEKIIQEETIKIWDKYNKIGGVKREELEEYYNGKESGYIIKIKEFFPFKEHVSPFEIQKTFRAPQSFKYLKGDEKEKFFYNLINP